jgi:hypothetical protein
MRTTTNIATKYYTAYRHILFLKGPIERKQGDFGAAEVQAVYQALILSLAGTNLHLSRG